MTSVLGPGSFTSTVRTAPDFRTVLRLAKLTVHSILASLGVSSTT